MYFRFYSYTVFAIEFRQDITMTDKKIKIGDNFFMSEKDIEWDIWQQEIKEEEDIESMEAFLEYSKEMEELFREEETLLSRILDSKYTKIEILKHKKAYIEVKWTIDLDPEEHKVVSLKRQFPNADIITTTYNWKIAKLQVIEKIKLKRKIDK